MNFRPTIKRFINGKVVEVSSKDATKPIPMSDAERLRRYTGERKDANRDKIDNPVSK